MQKEFIELIEYYDKNGICTERTANGIDLPPDTEPSIVILKDDVNWAKVNRVKQKTLITMEEFEKRFLN